MENASMQKTGKTNVCDSVGVTSAQRRRYVCPVADVDADVPFSGTSESLASAHEGRLDHMAQRCLFLPSQTVKFIWAWANLF